MLQHLRQVSNSPSSQLNACLPSPKIYAYPSSQIPEHPVWAKLDLLMCNWQDQEQKEHSTGYDSSWLAPGS
jgi:hypothetical protein